jgi:hypothetical protein
VLNVIVVEDMARAATARTGKRPPRVKLGGTVLAIIRLENGKQVRSRLHQLSTSGGVLQLENPLDEKIRVEVIFHVGSSTVRSQAVTLFPMWATKGCLQPFGFCDLPEKDRLSLQADLQQFLDQASSSSAQPRPQPFDTI